MFFQNKEKNKIKKELKKYKTTEKIYKKVKTTLDWCDIEKIENDCIILKDKSVVKGLKITPFNILLKEETNQNDFINNFRISLNKLNFKVYINFVHIPINIDKYLAHIHFLNEHTNDYPIKNLLENDYEKFNIFKSNFTETEFYFFVKEKDYKFLEKNYSTLKNELATNGFNPKDLTRLDYQNYLNYLFENPLINDFHFTKGIFKKLNTKTNLNDIDVDSEVLTLGNDDTLTTKSKLVPTSLKVYDDYMLIGDKFVSNYLVLQFPEQYNLGFLIPYTYNKNIKMFLSFKPINFPLSPIIKKDYHAKLYEYNKTTDPSIKVRLEKELIALNEYLKRSIANNDKTLETVLVFSIQADSLEELRENRKDFKTKMNAIDFLLTNCFCLQEEVYKMSLPIFSNFTFNNNIQENLFTPLTSESLVGLHPFVFETLKDSKGFLLGHEYYNGGLISFDPFYYVNEREERNFNQRINGNIIILGKSGSGKSITTGLLVRDFIKNGVKVVWVDPENKNEKLTKHYGGSYIEFGKRENIINVFDLIPITTDGKENTILTKEDIELMYDTDLAIKNAIEEVDIVLKYLFSNFSDNESSILSKIIIEAYKRKGIDKNVDGKYKTFNNYTSQDYPTFTTVYQVIQDMISVPALYEISALEISTLEILKLKIYKIINQWGVYFDGTTSISNNSIISFGIKELFTKSDNLKNAINHIVFSFAWSNCIRDYKSQSALIIDEAHLVILEEETSKKVANASRRARKYLTSLVLATQEPKDFADIKNLTNSKAIFNATTYKILMYLDKNAVEDLQDLVPLNDNEKSFIINSKTGDCLFFLGTRKIPIHIIATNKELSEIE